jgi:CBS domain-containing membrane protein
MSRDLILIEAPQPAMAAWQLLSHHQVKALPVVDEAGRLTGM